VEWEKRRCCRILLVQGKTTTDLESHGGLKGVFGARRDVRFACFMHAGFRRRPKRKLSLKRKVIQASYTTPSTSSIHGLLCAYLLAMHSIIRNGRHLTCPLFATPIHLRPAGQCRTISRNTAIAQGLREELGAKQGRSRRDRRDDGRRPYDPLASRSRRGEENELFGRKEKAKPSWDAGGIITHDELDESSWFSPLGFSNEKKIPPPVAAKPRDRGSYDNDNYKGPVSVPFTTAASEFLYGYSAVYAALKANKRKLYKLYVHKRSKLRGREPDLSGQTSTLQMLAEQLQVEVVTVDDKWLPVLDKMSDNRPHNVGFLPIRVARYHF
jgi:hypothetical protein